MGVLRKGNYTYGNKTWSEIIAITGAKVGSTVFDTDYKVKRIFDGNNFVHGKQKSMETTGAILDGAVMTVSSTADNKVHFHLGAGDNEGVIGIGEDEKTQSVGDIVPVVYLGKVKILCVAGTGGAALDPQDYIFLDSANAGYCEVSTSQAAGIFGFYIDTGITAPALKLCIFKPIERN